MTESELVDLVAVWQRRLGLHTWRIEVVVDVERWTTEHGDAGDAEAPDAWVRFRIRYNQAELHLNPRKAEGWTPASARQHVVHELVHLALRPLEVTVGPLEDLLHRDAWHVFDDQHDRALELVVDELAHRFVQLEDELTAADVAAFEVPPGEGVGG